MCNERFVFVAPASEPLAIADGMKSNGSFRNGIAKGRDLRAMLRECFLRKRGSFEARRFCVQIKQRGPLLLTACVRDKAECVLDQLGRI